MGKRSSARGKRLSCAVLQFRLLSPVQRTGYDRDCLGFGLRWVFGDKAVKFYMDPFQLIVESTIFIICRVRKRSMSILPLPEIEATNHK